MTLFTLVSIFVLIFLDIVLIGLAMNVVGAQQKKQTLARLDAIAMTGPMKAVGDRPLNVRRDTPTSTVPWLDTLIARLKLTQYLTLLLSQAGLNWAPAKLALFAIAAFGIFFLLVLLRTGVFLMSAMIGLCGASIPIFYVFSKRKKRFYRFKELLPEALDSIVAAIRAGHSLNSALGMTARESMEPVRGEFRLCFDEQNFGLDLRTSLNNLQTRIPLPAIRVMVTAILIQRETGGNLTEILERVAYLIREEFRLQRQVSVHTAQGRLTGWILSVLPPVLGFLMYIFNPGHMSLLWQRPIGLKMLYGAAILTTLGALVIRKIVRVRL